MSKNTKDEEGCEGLTDDEARALLLGDDDDGVENLLLASEWARGRIEEIQSLDLPHGIVGCELIAHALAFTCAPMPLDMARRLTHAFIEGIASGAHKVLGECAGTAGEQ